jgi:hypothetical protein
LVDNERFLPFRQKLEDFRRIAGPFFPPFRWEDFYELDQDETCSHCSSVGMMRPGAASNSLMYPDPPLQPAEARSGEGGRQHQACLQDYQAGDTIHLLTVSFYKLLYYTINLLPHGTFK